MVSPRSRTRLSPDARRQQLLDTTQALLISKGLQSFTMEGLAKAAAVSAPLVYNYFANRTELLQALLKREYQRFVEEFSSRWRGMRKILRTLSASRSRPILITKRRATFYLCCCPNPKYRIA